MTVQCKLNSILLQQLVASSYRKERPMASENVNVRIRGELKTHLQQQIGKDGIYDNAREYIRSLIRNDLKSRTESWDWLRQHLEPALRANSSSYAPVTAEDVIQRNKSK